MHVHLGIFLITFSGLIFEVGLTRIYSATIWYHFTFVIVSVALLGWGLGGFVLHLLKRRVTSSIDRAAGFTLAYACSIPLCLALLVRFPFTPERFTMYFIAPLVPFLLAGMALAMVFDLRRETAGASYVDDPTMLGDAVLQLTEYFAGARRDFSVALDWRGTPFQRAVWQAVLAIPYGETRSYGEVAAALGRPQAARAVGAANGANPLAPLVPCHRLIGLDGSLRGYGAGVEVKRWLLDLERGERGGEAGGAVLDPLCRANGGEEGVPGASRRGGGAQAERLRSRPKRDRRRA